MARPKEKNKHCIQQQQPSNPARAQRNRDPIAASVLDTTGLESMEGEILSKPE